MSANNICLQVEAVQMSINNLAFIKKQLKVHGLQSEECRNFLTVRL